jgi:hypothetical protein
MSRGRRLVVDTGVDIHRPIETVFDDGVDLTHGTGFEPSCRRVESLTPGRPRPGSRYVAELAGGERLVVRHEQLDRPVRWSSSASSSHLRASLVTELAARDGEVTRVRRHLEVEPMGVWRYARPLLRPWLVRRERRCLAAVKRTLEDR